MVETESRKAALIAEIEVSRGELRRALQKCEANLDPVLVVRDRVRKAPGLWLSGAALFGVALSKLVSGRRGSGRAGYAAGGGGGGGIDSFGGGWNGGGKPVGSGWFGSVCRVAFDLFRPLLAEWVNNRLATLARDWIVEQQGAKPQARSAPGDGKKG
jgi:hypothetical protein